MWGQADCREAGGPAVAVAAALALAPSDPVVAVGPGLRVEYRCGGRALEQVRARWCFAAGRRAVRGPEACKER